MILEMPQAIQLFGKGVGFGKSFTHPSRFDRVGPLHVLRDAPRTKGDYRNEEWVAHGVAPAQVDRIARQRARGLFSVCAIRTMEEPAKPIQDGYRALEYRFITTEPMMEHSLRSIPQHRPPAGFVIERVTTSAMADRLAKAARSRQMLPEHLKPDSPLRQYVVLQGSRLVGWVGSVLFGTTTWCRNMYVVAAFRRRGIGRALMSRMLKDDRAAGARAAFLVASHAGAALYRTMGYVQTGELMLFVPRRGVSAKRKGGGRTG